MFPENQNAEQENQTHLTYLENKSIDINIQRLRIGNKPLPNKKAQILKIKEYQNIIQMKSKDRLLTVEALLKLCTDIEDLEFEFPLRLLEPLQEITWNKMCEAMLIRDHYSISLLIKISKLIGLDLEFFEKYLEINEARKQSMLEKIERFLNFENISESMLNEELHFLIKECLRLDLRGPAIDQLFLIKEKRDEFIKQQIKDGFEYDQDLIKEEGPRGDCLRFLKMNEDHKKVPKSIFTIQINGNFFSHCTRADYGLLSKLSQKTLIEYDDTIDIILSKYETNYFIDLAYRRLQYFLEDFEDLESDNPFQIFDKVFQEGLQDLKLACARLNIQYRNFQARNIYHQNELQQIKAPLTQRPDEVIYPVDLISYSQEYTLTNFMYLKKFEFYFTPQEMALQNLQPSDMFQHRKEDTFIKPLIQFPVPEAQKDLEIAMTHLIYCVVVHSVENDGHKKIAPRLQQLIILLHKTQFSPHLKDEVYLQIVKFSSSPNMNDFQERNILSIISILTIYAPPSDELNHFLRAYLFNYYGKQRFSRIAQDAIVALQSAAISEIVIPDWVPSLYEIEQRVKGYSKFIFKIQYPNQTSQEFSIAPFITAGEFMKTIYEESQYFLQNSITDKYNFWIYQTSIYGEEEIALMYEEILMEVMSKWNQSKIQDFSLVVKRRIYQPFHTLRLNEMHQLQINCLLDEQLRYFYSNQDYARSIPVPTILRVASYYLAYMLKNGPKMKLDSKFVFNQLKSLIPPSLKYNKDDFSIVISEMIKVECIENFDKYMLMYNILAQLRFHNFFNSSVFTAKLNKSELESVFITVNAFCINIFNKQNFLKPQYSFYFEEIIYIVAVSSNLVILQVFNKDSKRFLILNINLIKPRAHELVQDVISYSYLRIQDDSYALYSYSEFYKLRYRHCLLQSPIDCGMMGISDPFTFEINQNLNMIEMGEARDKLQEIYQHVYKTQFIIGEVTDYPFYKDTTQFNLQYSERDMRRSTYQESQLQMWFNSVLKERKQMQDEILSKQQQDQENQKARRDKVNNYDSQNPSGVYSPDTHPVQTSSQQGSQQIPQNSNSYGKGIPNNQEPLGTSQSMVNGNSPNQQPAINPQMKTSSQIKEPGQQKNSLDLNESQKSRQSYSKSFAPKVEVMGTIQEIDNSNGQSFLQTGKLDNQIDSVVSPSNDPIKNANTAPSQYANQNQAGSGQFLEVKNDNLKEPQSATLSNKAEITNKKLNNKINNALSLRPGAPKSQQDLTQPPANNNPPVNESNKQVPTQQQKKDSLTTSQQFGSSSQKTVNKDQDQKQPSGNKQEVNTSQHLQLQRSSLENSEDNTLLRHSRQSSKEGLKSGSPNQSKERLKSFSRTSQNIYAQNKRTAAKKMSTQNSKDNLLEQGQAQQEGNVSPKVSQETEVVQSQSSLPVKKPPMFMNKKKV